MIAGIGFALMARRLAWLRVRNCPVTYAHRMDLELHEYQRIIMGAWLRRCCAVVYL
jgi:hypothetical protein